MKRLTISTRACTEILALLIHIAWADGKLEARERAGIRAATKVFNLEKDQRERLEKALESPLPLDQIMIETLGPHARSFAYVVAAWLTGIDDEVDPREQDDLANIAARLEIDRERSTELLQLARDLAHLKKSEEGWAAELVTLFKSIPHRLDASDESEVEVAFEGD
ncbi:MAG: DUF533 domain-containing protein [Polyangiaceae bacterium]